MQAKRNIRFVHVDPHGSWVERVRLFYAAQQSEHLYPRTHDELLSIAEDGAMFAVEHGDAIAAACYVKWEDEELRVREFGGICVGPEWAGKGIASKLSSLAIGQSLALAEISSLKANVHVNNSAPNGLLRSLGFVLTEGTATLPADAVRPPMKPSEVDGSVTGRVWEFDFRACRAISERLRSFPMAINGAVVILDFRESVGAARPHLLDLATELENIASEREMGE